MAVLGCAGRTVKASCTKYWRCGRYRIDFKIMKSLLPISMNYFEKDEV